MYTTSAVITAHGKMVDMWAYNTNVYTWLVEKESRGFIGQQLLDDKPRSHESTISPFTVEQRAWLLQIYKKNSC